MTTRDLAKELDQLARALRATSGEAGDYIATELELARHHHGQDGGRAGFGPKKLTLAAIGGALDAAASKVGPRAIELRSDVFERRVAKRAPLYADKLEDSLRRGLPIPAGEPVARNLSPGRAAGIRSYADAVGQFNRSPLAAEISAWDRAMTYVMPRIAPAYAHSALQPLAKTQERPGRDCWRIADDWRDKIDSWIANNTEYRCELDRGGKAVRVNGVNPAPFAALLAAVQNGNPDPLGILPKQAPGKP